MMSITHNQAVVLASDAKNLLGCAVIARADPNECGAWHGY